MKLRILFIFCSLIIAASSFSQGIRRAVVASTGSTGTTNIGGITLRCTVAQPPNSGTISNSAAKLRQGFQQPMFTVCSEKPQAVFEIDTVSTGDCGLVYNFIYTGIPENDTEFTWNFGMDAIPASSNLESPEGVIFSSSGLQTVLLEVSTDNCTFFMTSQFLVETPSLSATAEINDLLCYGENEGSILPEISAGRPPYFFNWSNNSTDQNQFGLAPGTYYFTLTDALNCFFMDSVSIQTPDSISIPGEITLPTSSCKNSEDGMIDISVSGGSPDTSGYIYQWSNGSITEDLLNINNGMFSVSVVDANGCEKQNSFFVDRVCNDFDFTNLITPNGDGANDFWFVPGIDIYPDNELEIYNRWGAQVYSATNYQNDWYGTNDSGIPLPAGAYYFIFKVVDAEEQVFAGSVSILR